MNEGPYFYVSAIDGARKYLVAGPYPSHQVALDQVPSVRSYAGDHDVRAVFMGWGTAASVVPVATSLGPDWGLPEARPALCH